MLEADMKKKICPIMSPAPRALVQDMFILCQGSACLAFGSRPANVFLAKDGKSETTMWPETLRLTDKSQLTKPGPMDVKDEIDEINRHIADGWKRQGVGSAVHFTKPGEPNCWCDAMAGNAQCGYEAP